LIDEDLVLLERHQSFVDHYAFTPLGGLGQLFADPPQQVGLMGRLAPAWAVIGAEFGADRSPGGG